MKLLLRLAGVRSMAKKNKAPNIVGGHGHSSDAELRREAMERYDAHYSFRRGARVASPDRDPWSWKSLKGRAELSDHFYGLRDRREINMMLGKPHGFAHARTANEGHTCYGSKGSSGKGHMIGKR